MSLDASDGTPTVAAPLPPFSMNIHEYQAKQLFEKFGVASPKKPMKVSP